MTRDARRMARWALVAAAALGATAAQAGGGYVALSAKGKQVLANCNPKDLPARQRCAVESLPGEAGYTLVASLASPLVKNEITIGTVYDQVWKGEGDDHIFASRVELTAVPYDLTGLAFNLNDLFRKVLDDQPVAIAYQKEPATKALKKSGRTLQGLKEPEPGDDDDDDDERVATGLFHGKQPTRDNAWVDFRIDANAAEPSGSSAANTPWLLVKTKAPAGFSLQPFALRLLSSDFADTSQNVDIYVPGYQPN
ncbi:MAG TPA: hypothetical protein VLA16_26500 [Ideonella sp.]|nr:hypothetical protein [Ideonella sp.]